MSANSAKASHHNDLYDENGLPPPSSLPSDNPVITDKTIAAQLSKMLLEISGQLDRSVAEVQGKCSDEEFNAYRRGAATVMWELYDQLLRPLYKTHPDLKPPELEID